MPRSAWVCCVFYNGQPTTDHGLMPILVPFRDALEKALFLIGQGVFAFALDLVEKLVHAAFLGLLLLHLAQALAVGTTLQPALPEAELLLFGLGRRAGGDGLLR